MTKLDYTSDELLPLSGIQHFVFCRRQWALITLERQWEDNLLTAEGKLRHERVDDPYFTEVRKGVIVTRAMPVASYRLGLIGVCDVVEFTSADTGIKLKGREGTFLPAPVEYKRGKEKHDRSDEAQLCAQAMCLEEMLAVQIPLGYLYYGEIRHRVTVELSAGLRTFVEQMAAEMHAYYERGHTPRVRTSKACRSCSLKDICLPGLQSDVMPASAYIKKHIAED